VTHWMAEQVGPDGHVTAMDLEPRHIPPGGNITIQQADVRTVELPEAHFDLIHARLVLVHIAERHAVPDRLAAAVKAGGVLVATEWETSFWPWLVHAADPAAPAAFDAFQAGLLGELEDHGLDPDWARRVPVAMRGAGLVEVEARAHNKLWS